MKARFFRTLSLGSLAAMAVALSACGPDASQSSSTPTQPMAAQPAAWSMNDLAQVDPSFLNDSAPLPQAVPMRAAAPVGDYADAPSFDYGNEAPPVFMNEPVSNGGGDPYALLALASSLGGMLGDAPPDYAFDYNGVRPWAWQTGDGYRRYAEPVSGGYRYYYYQPNAERPFLVRDPYYSYGYRDGQLVNVYDRGGRLLDASRADRQRQAARDYYARSDQLYRAAERDRRQAVSAPRWDQHRAEIAQEQRQWDDARRQRAAWQQAQATKTQELHRDWAGEALVRREAETRFAGWQQDDYRTPPPTFYTQQQRQAQLKQLADVRQAKAARAEADKRNAALQAQQDRQAQAQQDSARLREQAAQDQARQQQLADQRREQARIEASRNQQADSRQAAERNAREANAQEGLRNRQAALARAAQEKAIQAKAAEAKAIQAKTAEANAAQATAARARTAQMKAERAKAAQLKAQQARAAQAKAGQARDAAQAKAKTEQAKADRAKAAQANAAQVKAAQAKAAQAKAAQANAEHAKAVRVNAEQATAARIKVAQAKADQAKAAQARADQANAQAKAAQAKAEQAKAAEAKAAQAKAAQGRAAQAKAAQEKAGQAKIARVKADAQAKGKLEREKKQHDLHAVPDAG